jgi:predicted nucleic acid binding AN1-type Zn finger protein
MTSNNRCKKCNRKNSFVLKCKCGNNYCTKDILPEIHECTEMHIFRKEAYDKNDKMLTEATKKEKVDWIT